MSSSTLTEDTTVFSFQWNEKVPLCFYTKKNEPLVEYEDERIVQVKVVNSGLKTEGIRI